MSRVQNSSRESLDRINDMDREDFVRLFGGVFEHSPWVAEHAYERRPFGDVEELHGAMVEAVRHAGEQKQLDLIRAHPDLVGRLAREGRLTAASTREQAGAGLDQLSDKEVALFDRYNAAYHARFGFPFVICARENRKDAILDAFPRRLQNDLRQEMDTALSEIARIAWFRLHDLVDDP